jgi:hypothetical protein
MPANLGMCLFILSVVCRLLRFFFGPISMVPSNINFVLSQTMYCL